MTMRERILAMIRGDTLDRVPFVQYSGLAGPDDEIWSAIGRDRMGIMYWSSVFRHERPNCRVDRERVERDGVRGERAVMTTPAGRLVEEKFFEPGFGTAHITKHFIAEPADYRVFLSFLRDTVVVEDMDRWYRDERACGDDGVPFCSMGRTPYQQMWIEWVSLEDLSLHLIEEPDLVHECMDEIAAIHRRAFDLVWKAAGEVDMAFANFGDNITAPCIGPRNFREWCVPLYDELAGVLDDRGVPVFVHMDGDLKPLAGDIATSGVTGLDSFSPKPDNDTSVAEARTAWPEMHLLVNFPSSVHLEPPERIYETATEILEDGAHGGKLQIQISENVPPERWRVSFPEIVRAIDDFGTPV